MYSLSENETFFSGKEAGHSSAEVPGARSWTGRSRTSLYGRLPPVEARDDDERVVLKEGTSCDSNQMSVSISVSNREEPTHLNLI